jgi:hypothetical protein
MKKLVMAAGLALLCVPAVSTLAAETQVKWQEPEEFTDIDAGDEHPEQFRERVLEGLEETFVRLGERLPSDQILRITVTDLTLAGRIEPMQTYRGLEQVRVVRPMYEPRMDLMYELVDAESNVIDAGEASLRGSRLLDQAQIRRAGTEDIVKYESNMVERWFRRQFEQQLKEAK